jgi:hypothetical protein
MKYEVIRKIKKPIEDLGFIVALIIRPIIRNDISIGNVARAFRKSTRSGLWLRNSLKSCLSRTNKHATTSGQL